MAGKSLFGQNEEELIRKQAQNLLNDYSHPWDSLAEGIQNALDAINRRYRFLLADELGITEENLRMGIGNASDDVINQDKQKYLDDYESWASEEYQSVQRSRWYEALSEEIDPNADQIRDADERVRANYSGEVEIERIDSSRSIRICDNGIGMSLEELDWAVLKGGSHKDGVSVDTSEIGELGNGLTYQICSSNFFKITTSDGEGIYDNEIEDMYNWIKDKEGSIVPDQPKSNPQQISEDDSDRFTEVKMEGIRKVSSDYPDLFSDEMTTTRFIHLLRTKTAIGYLYDMLNFPVYDSLRADDITITVLDTTDIGTETIEDISLRYNGPASICKGDNPTGDEDPPTDTTLLSRDKAKELVSANSNIGGSALYHKGVFESASGITLYYLAFVSSRDWYRKASHTFALCENPGGDVDDLGEYDVRPAIELGVKGMPTAVTVSPPSGDSIGYWANLHIIIMDNRLEFDEGRKSVVGRRKALYRDCAHHALYKDITVNLIQNAIKDPVVSFNLSKMAEHKNEFVQKYTDSRTELDYSCLPDQVRTVNVPESEQDLVTLFHELIVGGIFSQYSCLAASSYSTYDAIFNYTASLSDVGSRVRMSESDDPIDENVIVEYKLDGEDLIQDVNKHVKFYYMMDILICWEIDPSACSQLAATLVEKDSSHVRYWGTTHELKLNPVHFDNVGTGQSVDVIELKTLLEELSNGKYSIR